MLTETHRHAVVINPAAGRHCHRDRAILKENNRKSEGLDDGFGRGAESIVKNTVPEAHAHGDTPRRSHNESGG